MPRPLSEFDAAYCRSENEDRVIPGPFRGKFRWLDFIASWQGAMARSFRVSVLLTALLVLAGQAALAQQPETDEESLALARELDQRERHVEDLRGELGVYHPALQEVYGELGGFYLELEDYEQSVSIYNDALEIARINEGLYSESQLRIIDAMIAGNEGLTDWEAVDDLHHFRYHMASRLWGLTDRRHLAAIGTWGGWKMRAIRDDLLGDSSWGVQAAIDDAGSVYRRAITALEQEPEAQPLDLANLVRGKAELDIYMMRAVANTPYNYFPATVPRYVNQMRCRMVPAPNGQAVRQCVNVQVENPRFRESQRRNKLTTLTRYSNAINSGIERLTAIRDRGDGLSIETLAQIDAQIAQLEAENQQYFRRGRRDSLF